MSDTGEVATAANSGKLVDTSAFLDQEIEFNMLHNFIVPIPLVLIQKLGGANQPKWGPYKEIEDMCKNRIPSARE